MTWQDLTESISDTCIDTFSESIEVHFFNKVTNTFDIEVSRGVFDSDYKQLDMNTGAIISSNAPMVEISKRFITKNLTNKDKILARGTLYNVREIMPDASGAIKVILSRS
jgi:hypothetical protein